MGVIIQSGRQWLAAFFFVSCAAPSLHAQPHAREAVVTVQQAAIQAVTDCPHLYHAATPPRLTNSRLGQHTRELCSDHYAVLYSGVARSPLYAAEYLTKGKVVASREFGRTNDFRPDTRLPKDWRSELADFRKSGFDRGHLAPSADMPTPAADSQSFLLSNIVAQNPQLNRKLWAAIEKAVRALAMHRPVYTITGVLFKGERIERLNNRVMIPTHLYKLVFEPKQNAAAAYLVENQANRRHREISLEELETLAGVEFFPKNSKIGRLKLPRPRY